MFMYVDYLLIHSLVRMVCAHSLVGVCVYCCLVVLSPRFNVRLCLVVGSNLGGDSSFMR